MSLGRYTFQKTFADVPSERASVSRKTAGFGNWAVTEKHFTAAGKRHWVEDQMENRKKRRGV